DLSYWFPRPTIDGLRTLKTRSDAEAYLRSHPEVVRLLPHLIDRGEEAGRTLVIALANAAQTPELLAMLRDLGLGQRGADKVRLDAVLAARRWEAVPAGKIRMWIKGEWREQLLL